MNTAWFRFYEELNDFLPVKKRKQEFAYSFSGNPAVKDAVEAIGIPHVEIDLIVVNGQSVDFSHKIRNEDHVSVYPTFESLDISPLIKLREKPLRKTKFITDVHLGKLARHLRMCGFDTSYGIYNDDNEIIDVSLSEGRIILTRDRGLLKNGKVTHAQWIRSQEPKKQLREVISRLQLQKKIEPFTRCIECNGLLTEISKEEVTGLVPPRTMKYFCLFKKCNDCGHVYWQGSHFDKMKNLIDEIRRLSY